VSHLELAWDRDEVDVAREILLEKTGGIDTVAAALREQFVVGQRKSSDVD